MQYRVDPKSGNKLSALGFGCMRFPRGISIDYAKSEKLVLDAIKRGVNYFDTAYIYPGSEDTLGEILHKNHVREKIFLATKLPHGRCKTYEEFDRLFNEQLRRLKTDYIDYYLIHNVPDMAAWNAVSAVGLEKWLAEKKASGQIRSVGFSFHGTQASFLELLDVYPWDFCQIQYHYMNGVTKKAVKLFGEANPRITPAAWAMKWLWNQPEVTVVLSGMNASEQLDDNISTAEHTAVGSLTDRELAVFNKVKAVFEESYKVPCTGCNYCMPCPKNVNIPGCFAAYNASYANGFVTGMTQYLTSTNALHSSGGMRVANCVRCGICEKKCPQHIKIPSELGNVKKRLEPFGFSAGLKIIGQITGGKK